MTQPEMTQPTKPQTEKRQDEPARNPHANTARFCQQGFLQRDALVSLSAETTHHARNVLRLQAGEQVRLFNKECGEWLAEIVDWQKSKEGSARCLRCLREAQECDAEQQGPTLYFSPISSHRLVWLLSGAVELGVSRLVPFRSRYTNAHFSHARAARTIQSAVEQSERLTCPVLEAEQSLSAVLAARQSCDNGERLLFCAERGEAACLHDALGDALKNPLEEHAETKRVAMLVGPEGGFSDEEQTMLRAYRSVVPVSLGERVLRCETAVVAVLACWQAFQGQWKPRQ